MAARIAVALAAGGSEALAVDLGLRLNLPRVTVPLPDALSGALDALLVVDESGPCLQLLGDAVPGPVRCEFGNPAMRHRRRGGHNEPLGRALALQRRPGQRVIDCTGGFGQDSFVIADLGAHVVTCERNPILAALLDHAWQQCLASQDPWLHETSERMQVYSRDARTLPQAEIAGADALYLDPMFPEEGKRAASGKSMAVLQRLLPDDADYAYELIEWALSQPVSRVVVKRPRRSSHLGSRRPGHSLEGRSVRFDVYPLTNPADPAGDTHEK